MTANKKAEGLALLREPFAANQISMLPRITCQDCSRRSCQQHQKNRCKNCGSYITSAHIDLEYVGHAALTDRLLDADPAWTWEPVAFDATGLPAFDAVGGLWIRLTIAGQTRLGYGDAQGKSGPNAVKECIGDALRNAAMRFGAALDLWHKGDLHADENTVAVMEHQRLANDTVADDKKATRTGGPDPDDPWAAAKPGSGEVVTGLLAEVEASTDPVVLRELYQRVVDFRGAGDLTKEQAEEVLTACTAKGNAMKEAS